MKRDCIYFEATYKELEFPKFRHCSYSKALFVKGQEDEDMCKNCRLWDAYIPKSSTPEQINKAKMWQNLPLDKQPDYHEFFKL